MPCPGLPSICWLFPRFAKHLLGCFPGLAWLFPRFTKHLLGCFPGLPSTCWLFPGGLQVTIINMMWENDSGKKFLRCDQFFLLGFIAGCPLLCMAKTTKMSNSVFVNMTPFFGFAAACGGGAFSFLYKVTADCDRASEGPFTLCSMGIMVDARFATLAGQANH